MKDDRILLQTTLQIRICLSFNIIRTISMLALIKELFVHDVIL